MAARISWVLIWTMISSIADIVDLARGHADDSEPQSTLQEMLDLVSNTSTTVAGDRLRVIHVKGTSFAALHGNIMRVSKKAVQKKPATSSWVQAELGSRIALLCCRHTDINRCSLARRVACVLEQLNLSFSFSQP